MTSYTVGQDGCAKRRYRSERSAIEAHRLAGYRLRAYLCPRCNGWHTTNADKNPRSYEPPPAHAKHRLRNQPAALAPVLSLSELEAIAAERRRA